MKILLTGSTGMVGKNLLEHPGITKLELLTPSSKELDLLDYKKVHNYINREKPDFIIHAAGRVGGIQANMAHPVAYLVENTEMGRNLLMAAKDNNILKLLNLASSCMYPRMAENPLREELILKGELEPTNEGYALSKIFSTRLCEYISRENPNLMYKTVIPCNLYGRHDKFDPENSHMVPAVIRKIHEGKARGIPEIEIWGDGLARREFMYSGDLADFLIHAISNFEKMPQNINVGIGEDYSINEYYQIIAEIIGFQGGFNHRLDKPVGMKQKLIDNSKLQKFGWKPKTTLGSGIKNTYNYFLKEIYNAEV